MDIPNIRISRDRSIAAVAIAITTTLMLSPGVGLAQVPYSIDGTVPDANCCVELQDPVGSISELGPVNSSGTKLGTISSATPPMRRRAS